MSENGELNTAKLDISNNSTRFKENKLNTFLQGAYDRTAKVSHNRNCTFHSMGRNILEMLLEDIRNNIKDGLAERIIKKLIQKHGNKLKNPIWVCNTWRPDKTRAYRKSFWESVKYYFSNAKWGWFNIINPFFWLSELIWGEYVNDLYSINKSDEVELHIDKNLSEREKYRIGNILGQLIREEIADAITEAKDQQKNEANLKTSNIDDFVNVKTGSENEIQKNSNETDKLKINPKKKTELSYKRKMTQSILDASPGKKFDIPYVDQGSKFIVYEWQYLTSNDFLEETNENNPLETIVLEVNKKPISAENAKLVFSGFDYTLDFDYNNIGEIAKKLGDYNKITDRNKLPLICVIAEGFLIGRCQPIVGYKNKQEFIENLLTAIEGDRVVSTHDKIKMLTENNKDKGADIDIDSDKKNTNEQLKTK